MAGEGIPYRADTGGGVGATPDLRAPLGPPSILRPEDFIAMANFNDPTVALKNAYDLTSSLIDNHYNNQIALAKSQADLAETAARTGQYQAQTDNIQSESDQRKQQLPLLIKQDNQRIQQNDFALKEAQRQSDTLDKALSEYGPWNSELAALDPTDPDYDNKVATINAKYPEASTNPRTQALITPLLTEHNVKRSQSDLVQQRTDQLTQARSYVQSGLLPPDTDIRAEVNAGRGQALINQAKSQSVIHRLQTISALGTPQDRFWAQGEIGAITGKALGPGETPDRTMFTPTGDLNPGTDLVLSRIEQRLGITPVAPGAKKEIKTTVDETTGQPKTETTITGMPVTQADINAQKPQTAPATVPGAPTTAADMQKDPIFQSIFSDIAQKKLALQGAPGSQEQTAALYAEYAKRKAAAAAGQQPAQPSAAPTPGTTSTQVVPTHVAYSTERKEWDLQMPDGTTKHLPLDAYSGSGPVAVASQQQQPTKLEGMSTVFHWNYDGSRDQQDPGSYGFFGHNLDDKGLVGVAVPVDVLEKKFGHFAQPTPDGHYTPVDTPEAKAIMQKIQSAHVELPDANGQIHQFPIVDIQGSLARHPGHVLDMTLAATKEMGFNDNHHVRYQIIG
jgi:hypothetical protein